MVLGVVTPLYLPLIAPPSNFCPTVLFKLRQRYLFNLIDPTPISSFFQSTTFNLSSKKNFVSQPQSWFSAGVCEYPLLDPTHLQR